MKNLVLLRIFEDHYIQEQTTFDLEEVTEEEITKIMSVVENYHQSKYRIKKEKKGVILNKEKYFFSGIKIPLFTPKTKAEMIIDRSQAKTLISIESILNSNQERYNFMQEIAELNPVLDDQSKRMYENIKDFYDGE